MMDQQTIKGSDLLKRWGAMPFKLAGAIRAGLVPIDTSLGTRRTPDVDPCLVCQGKVALRTCTGCQRETIERIVDGKQVITVNRHCQLMDKDGRFETGFREYIGQAEFILSEVEAYEKVHGVAATTATTEPGHDQQVGIPQLDPPESLPATAKEYNEQLRQRGYDAAIRMYMIRNAHAREKWGKMRNWTAAAIALGRPVPEESDKDEIARLNNRYYEHVTEGLRDYLPKSKKAKKKQS